MREFRLSELAELTGVPERRIRHYIDKGLLPGAVRRGRSARYGEDSLEALKRIVELKSVTLPSVDRRLTLSEIQFALQNQESLKTWRDYFEKDESCKIASDWQASVRRALELEVEEPAQNFFPGPIEIALSVLRAIDRAVDMSAAGELPDDVWYRHQSDGFSFSIRLFAEQESADRWRKEVQLAEHALRVVASKNH